MARFFFHFPKIEYKFADGTTQKLVDTNVKFNLNDMVRSKPETLYKFSWRDGDRVDILSDKYYKTSDYYWLILMANNMYDEFHDVAMPTTTFLKYVINKYRKIAEESDALSDESVIAYMFQTIHHYEDEDGYWIDHDTFLVKGNTKSVSIYEYEFLLNESKRNVVLISDSDSARVKNELESKLTKIKANI